MKTWTSITEKSVSHYLYPTQLEALRQHSDPLDAIIADTVAMVRAEIRNNPKNQYNPDPSLIPKELKRPTCHLIIEALQSRIPSLKLTSDQIHNANVARALLRRMASAELSLYAFSQIHPLNKNAEIARMRQRQATFETLSEL